MRIPACLLFALVVCSLAFAKSDQQPAPELEAARQALARNLALGDGLAGAPATPEQASEATRAIEEGLACARGYAVQQPRSAEAHRLIGMLLLFTYRPAQTKQTKATAGDAGGEQQVTVLRRRSSESLEEGAAELRAAARLAPQNADYQLDYSEALAMSGETKRGLDLIGALWQRKGLMPSQLERGARLAAQAARDLRQPADEQRWLRELLRANARDEAAAKRLAEIAPPATTTAGVAWQDYESGMSQARGEGKPVMIDFMADWCGWCKKLDAEVYTKSEVMGLSRRFVCIKVNTDRRPDLARRYQVDGLPTIVFLSSLGQETNRVGGYKPAQVFLGEMRKSLPSK